MSARLRMHAHVLLLIALLAVVLRTPPVAAAEATPEPRASASRMSWPSLGNPAANPSSARPPIGGSTAARAAGLLEEELKRVEGEVSELRGLEKRADVPVRILDRAGVRQHVADAVARDFRPEDRDVQRKLLIALGVANPAQGAGRARPGRELAHPSGIYDWTDKAIYVLSERGELGPMERFVFAHEFTHALQDQHFGLERLMPRRADNVDRSLAIHALVEGDATLLMRLWARKNLSAEEAAGLGGRAGSLPEHAASGEVALRDVSIYDIGLRFARQAYDMAGEYSGVDFAFRNPPESTEQILHLDKYWTREQPVAVTIPDLPALLGPGWRTLDSKVMGELHLRALLERHAGPTAAAESAAGWAGGRWLLLENDDRQALVLKTAWDSDQDAREFFEAYAHVLRTRFEDAEPRAAEPTHQALATAGAATELRRSGSDVLAVISFDRASAEAIVAAIGGF